MPLAQKLLLYVPTLILGVGIVTGFIALSISGLVIVRRFVPHHKLKLHNDVAGAIFSTAGVAYAVLLAFVVLIAWQGFDRSNINVEREANCIVSVYRDTVSFSPAFQEKVRPLIREYVNIVTGEEWPMLARGRQSMNARDALKNVWLAYASYEPKSENEKTFFAESVRKLNDAGELRRMRLMDSRTGLHPIIWIVLITGGISTVIFTFFFGTENFRAQVMMASMLALIIALILFTILLLDFPFTGGVHIPADAFKEMAHF